MNYFERLISFVAPTYALERQKSKMVMSNLRSFDAAKKGRRSEGWTATGTSQNAEVEAASAALRDRSRDLVRNNPFVKRAVQSISNNVIGKGILAKVKTSNKRSAKRVDDAWKGWWNSTDCDWDGKQRGAGIQKLVAKAVIESGGCLIMKRRVNADVPLELQVLEIDYLDISKNEPKTQSGGFIFMGIEFNKAGKKTHYWIYDKHPGDSNGIGYARSTPRKAENVIHVFEQLRPGQQVGVPFGVSAFVRVRDMEEYNDAQVVRQKIAACYSVMITGEGAGIDLPTEDQDELERIEPGMIHRMNNGETVTFGSPPTVENFGEFSRTILQGVAAGFGTTYENLTGDLSNVNFSSGRMGWIEHHRNVDDWQLNLFIPQMCDPIFRWFLEAIELKGINTSGVTVEWTPPRREMIDPSKEVKGIVARVRSGLISPIDAIRAEGYDPEEVLAEIVDWNKKLDDNGIILDSDPRQGKGEEPNGRGRPSSEGKSVDDDVDEK